MVPLIKLFITVTGDMTFDLVRVDPHVMVPLWWRWCLRVDPGVMVPLWWRWCLRVDPDVMVPLWWRWCLRVDPDVMVLLWWRWSLRVDPDVMVPPWRRWCLMAVSCLRAVPVTVDLDPDVMETLLLLLGLMAVMIEWTWRGLKGSWTGRERRRRHRSPGKVSITWIHGSCSAGMIPQRVDVRKPGGPPRISINISSVYQCWLHLPALPVVVVVVVVAHGTQAPLPVRGRFVGLG